MLRSKLEWILIAAFLLFHFLFLFLEANSNIYLGLSSLFFILLTLQYMVLSKSGIYFLAFALNAGSVIGVNMKLEHLQGAPEVRIAGMVGYVLIALIVIFIALRNKQKINGYAFLPFAISALMIAQVVLLYLPHLAQYSSFLNYAIVLFCGQILLSGISPAEELRGFYCALKLVLLSSGISVLDQTITSL